MNRKLIEGTHYSISQDGKVWNEKYNRQVKRIGISTRKLLRTYFPQSIVAPQIEGVEHKSIGNYQIYDNGQIWSRKHCKFLTPTVNAFGHLTIDIDGKAKRVHRLVYQTFVGVIPKGYDIHHRDFNKNNNSISNLICLTHEEHSKLHSKFKKPMSEEKKQYLSELNKGKVLTEEHKAKIAASKKAWWDKQKVLKKN